MDFDDGRVDADEDFGFVQIRDVAAGENGGGAFGVGDQGGDQAGSAAFHGGNGGVGCNELFDDGINGVWAVSYTHLDVYKRQELAEALQLDMKPNLLTKHLNVNKARLFNEYQIDYEPVRTHAGRRIILNRVSPQRDDA